MFCFFFLLGFFCVVVFQTVERNVKHSTPNDPNNVFTEGFIKWKSKLGHIQIFCTPAKRLNRVTSWEIQPCAIMFLSKAVELQKPNTKKKTLSQLHSGDPWSEARGLALLRSTPLPPCQQHEGRYQLNHSCTLKDFSSLYLAHGNSREHHKGSHSSQPGRTSTLVWSPIALSSASKNSQKLWLLHKHQCLAMPAGSGPWAMLTAPQ